MRGSSRTRSRISLLRSLRSVSHFSDAPPLTHLLPTIKKLQWPGRLQMIDISKITGRQQPVLLDGAHNLSLPRWLATFTGSRLRSGGQPITWVLAATKGKDMDGIFGLLIRPGDQLLRFV